MNEIYRAIFTCHLKKFKKLRKKKFVYLHQIGYKYKVEWAFDCGLRDLCGIGFSVWKTWKLNKRVESNRCKYAYWLPDGVVGIMKLKRGMLCRILNICVCIKHPHSHPSIQKKRVCAYVCTRVRRKFVIASMVNKKNREK